MSSHRCVFLNLKFMKSNFSDTYQKNRTLGNPHRSTIHSPSFNQLVSLDRSGPQQNIKLIPSVQPVLDDESPKSGLSINRQKYKARYSRIVVNQDLVQFQKRISSKLKYQQDSPIRNYFKNRDLPKKFLKKLLTKSNFLSLKNLTSKQVQTIHTLQNIQNKLLPFYEIPAFDVINSITLLNDLIQLLLALFTFFLYPLQMSFEIINQRLMRQFDFLYMTIILVDILLHLNRSIIKRGTIVRDRKQIVRMYVKTNLPRDLIVLIAITVRESFVGSQQSLPLIVYLLARLPRVLQIVEIVNNYFNFNNQMREILQLFYMIFSLIYVVHFVACIWHSIGNMPNCLSCWVTRYGYEDSSFIVRYQVSFYWAAMTMTTVGYGDITPKTQIEYFFANLTMLVACVVFGYTLNRIGMLLSNIQATKAQFKKDMALMNNYMKNNKVTYELQSRIRSYLDFQQKLENDQHQKDVQLLIEKLSDQLKADLLYQVRGQTIEKCKVFERFSAETKRKLCKIVETANIAPNEVLLHPKINDGNSLYIIQSGQAKIELSERKLVCPNLCLRKGETVGQLSFFTDQPRSALISTVGYVNLLKIQRSKFINLIAESSRDWELFHYLKDSLIFNEQFQKLQINCLFCNSDFHLITRCPLLNVSVDREKIYKQCCYPTTQDRVNRYQGFDFREKKRKFPTFLNFLETSITVKNFQRLVKREKSLLNASSDDEDIFSSANSQKNIPYLPEIPIDDEHKDSPRQTDYNNDFANRKKSQSVHKKQQSNKELFQKNQNQAKSDNLNIKDDDQDDSCSISIQGSNLHYSPQVVKSKFQDNKSAKFVLQSIELFDFLVVSDFDRMHTFKNYFPQGNVQRVIKSITSFSQKQTTNISQYFLNYQDSIRAARVRKRWYKFNKYTSEQERSSPRANRNQN